MQNLYKLREACTIHPYDGRADEAAFIVRAPDKRQFKISSTAKDILVQLDGKTTLDEVAAKLSSRSIEVSTEDLLTLISDKYYPLGIVEDVDDRFAPLPETAQKIRLPFLLHWDLIPEKFVQTASSRLKFMFSRASVLLAILSIAAAHYVIYFKYPTAEFRAHASFLPVMLLCLLSVLCHEFGHSSAVSRYGGSPGKIGFGLFILLPSFYADVSEIWRFPRKHRMVVDLGGIYFQEIFFVASALLGVLTHRPEYFVVCRFIDLMVLLTMNPVIRFDGYWLLADWLALPNLYRLSLGYLGGTIKRFFVRGQSVALLPSMPHRKRMVFVAYAVLSNLFLAGLAWTSYRYIYSTFARVTLILPATFNSMLFAFKAHDLTLVITKLVTLFFVIAFPVTALVGMYRYGAILVGYSTRKMRAAAVAKRYPRSRVSEDREEAK